MIEIVAKMRLLDLSTVIPYIKVNIQAASQNRAKLARPHINLAYTPIQFKSDQKPAGTRAEPHA